MSLNYLILIIIVLFNLFLGFITLKGGHGKRSSLFFSLLVFTLALWILVSFLEDEITNILIAQNLVNIDFLLASLMVSFFLIFCCIFPDSKKIKVKKYLYLLLPAFFFGLISLSSSIISDVNINPNGLEFIYGNFFIPFLVYIFIYFSAGIYILIKKIITLKGISKLQTGYVLFGLFISAFIIIFTNLVLPMLLDVTSGVTRLGIYGTLFVVLSTSYAIVKHRLMDIRMVVARSVAFMLFFVLVISSGGLLMMWLPSFIFSVEAFEQYNAIFRSIVGIMMIFAFQPVRRFITRVTDKIFFKNDYDLHELTKKITNNIYSTLILIELLYKIIDLLIKEMKVSRGFFVLLDEKGKIHTSQSIGYKKNPQLHEKDIRGLSKHGIMLFDDLDDSSHLKSLLRRCNASISIGLVHKDSMIGVLLLGEKSSGDMYNSKDIKLFDILAPEMVIAIQRAVEHEKVQNFNVFLQSEVARKTKELSEANDHLRELDKAKDEFISMASHQLRTPLTAIKGYLSMLLEGDAGEVKMSQYDFINEAFTAGNRMVALINDLLNVSRMDTGRFFLEPVVIDIERVVQEEIKQLTNTAREKKLFLKYEKRTDHIPPITVDETKIRQVIMNFIDNSIYYTMKGGVTISLDKEKNNLVFKVEDTGIGVPEKEKEQLFTKFFRAENARTTRPDGTGLGIYLAKKVVEDHGGEIIFDSKEGKGSVFGFKLPLKAKIKKEITMFPADLTEIQK